MITLTDNEDYVYTSKIFVNDTFFEYFDYTDPDVRINPMRLNSGQIVAMISSRVFADKYSSRNWIYKKLKMAFANGATLKDLCVVGFSCVACHGHRVERAKASSHWLRFPPDDDQAFMRSDDDIEFSLAFGQYLTGKRDFKFDLLLDSSNYHLNQLVTKGEKTFGIKGPDSAPFKFVLSANPSSIQESITNLTADCLNYKAYTVPSNTTVDLKAASYRYVEIIEESNSVVFIFRDNMDYFTLGFDIATGEWIDDFVTLFSAHRSISDEEIDEHKLSIKYLGAILLHDFWVVEYRERNKIYAPKRTQPILSSHRWAGVDLDGRTNIYMPRIKYYSNKMNQSVVVGDDEVELVIDGVFQPRKIHRVAHIRNLEKANRIPNPDQVLLAEEYGIKVPVGYTFVRPSHADESENFKNELVERSKIYFSRTALGTLFNVEVFQDNYVEIKWLKFQNDCVKYCKDILGLQPLPRHLRKRGDGGIDIICFEKQGRNIVYWVIQCKCWSRDRVVGIQILRELFASGEWTSELSDNQKKHLRYMIITSSRFSTDVDFVKQAQQSRIVLVDGETFAKRVPPSMV